MLLDEHGQRITYHEEDGKVILAYHTPDLEPVMKANHEQMVSRSRFDKKGELHHVMRVPTHVLLDIKNRTGLDFWNPDDAREILKILKGPDYAAWRTYPGRI